jgi:N-acetylglucosaminyldiphosphoundecaprenol N-acetyl-beta-D-mannosaminyltransferase
LFGIPVDLAGRESLLAAAENCFRADRACLAVTVNPLLVLASEKQAPALREVCESADISISDSAGLSWAFRRLQVPKPDRYPGIDFAFDLCAKAATAGVSVYLLGGEPGIAERAARVLVERLPTLKIGGVRDGFFGPAQDAEIIASIRRSDARLVLRALGMPKQELWYHDHRSELPPALYVGVGGTLDVWAGKVKRAPEVWQRWGLEWLYRLFQEPSRWRRMAQLPLFAARVWAASLKRP